MQVVKGWGAAVRYELAAFAEEGHDVRRHLDVRSEIVHMHLLRPSL